MLFAVAAWVFVPVPRLTRPGGRYSVGTEVFRWIDASRAEEATANAADKRNVIVQAWYPIAPGARGGGVGFGAMRPSYGAPNFAGAGSRFSSFGRPSSRQPVYDSRPTRSMTHSGGMAASDQQQNRFASGASHEQGARPELTRQLAQRFPGLRDHIAAQHNANWHNDWDRRHVHFDHGRFFVFADGFWCGLDDGFFPWDYLPYYPDDYYPYDYYTNTDPYDYNGNTYDLGSGDSATVQAVQTQLR